MKKAGWLMALLAMGAALLVFASRIWTGSAPDGTPPAGESGQTGGQAVTIDYYDWSDEQAYMDRVVSAFEHEYPDIRVRAHYFPSGDYPQKILVNLSTGSEAMDVFATQSTSNLAEYISKDVLAPLDDLTGTGQLAGNRDSIEQLRYNGHIYGFPYRTSKWVLYYNKDLFDRAGIPYPDKTWTWERYERAADRLTGGSGADKIYGSINYPSSNTWWRVPALLEGANNPFNPGDLLQFRKALAYYYRLTYADGAARPFRELVGNTQTDFTNLMIEGRAAMMWNGDWAVQMLNDAMATKKANLNYDVAPLPHWEGSPPSTTGSFAVVMVNKQSGRLDAAKKLAAFIGSEEAAEILAANGLLTPWSTEAVQRIYRTKVKTPEHAEVFYDDTKVLSQVPMDPLYNRGMNIVGEEASLYLLQKQDLDTTFLHIENRIRKVGR